MTIEQAFYPPNSFPTSQHWVLEIRKVDGSFTTYTEHRTQKAGLSQLERLVSSDPKGDFNLIFVDPAKS